MSRKHHPNDVSREQFEPIRALLDGARQKRRPRQVDLYDVFCAMVIAHECSRGAGATGRFPGTEHGALLLRSILPVRDGALTTQTRKDLRSLVKVLADGDYKGDAFAAAVRTTLGAEVGSPSAVKCAALPSCPSGGWSNAPSPGCISSADGCDFRRMS